MSEKSRKPESPLQTDSSSASKPKDREEMAMQYQAVVVNFDRKSAEYVTTPNVKAALQAEATASGSTPPPDRDAQVAALQEDNDEQRRLLEAHRYEFTVRSLRSGMSAEQADQSLHDFEADAEATYA